MKAFVYLLIAATLPFWAVAAPHEHQDRPSTHGMAVVGAEKIYVSHLPMFHSPHDYQVIMEVEMDLKTRTLYTGSLAKFSETVYTVAPETGVLPAMAKEGASFKVDLFRGHFERGGAAIAENVTITVKQVLYFKKLLASEPKPPAEQSLVFGNAKEQFAAHLITGKPNFDRLSKVDAFEIDIDGHPVTMNTKDLKVKKVLYFETGDLEL